MSGLRWCPPQLPVLRWESGDYPHLLMHGQLFCLKRPPLHLADMPGVEVLAAILSHPQEDSQSKDRQAEHGVDGL